MALSAFRSTTKRGCQIGSESAEPSVPSTPRSKRDPSPSGRGSHRRSTSMTDFSAKYLSDCSSASEYRSSYNKNSDIKAGRRSVCPSDSESDMECLSVHRRHQRRGAESEDERPRNPRFSVTNVADSQRKGLRRTLSSQDLSQYNSKPSHHAVVLDKKPERDDTEDLVEEKTIRAVYAQMKSLRSEPPVGDVGMTDFLDAMRSEVRRAVADIRMELEESMRKNGKLLSTMDEGNRMESQGTDVIQAVADIRKEYSTKLEESEKRVRELWSQIAVEERRCLELSKIVKELLPTPPPLGLQTSTPQASSNRRRPLRRKNSAEKQIVLKSLDDEAQKYFEECVSISSFDCQGDSDDSLREKENSSSYRQGRSVDGEIAAKSPSAEGNVKGEMQPKDSLVGNDGVVLPWLQWEYEAGGGGDKNPKQVAKKHVIAKSSSNGSRSLLNRVSGSSNQFYMTGNAKSNATRKLASRTTADLGQASHTVSIAASSGGESGIPMSETLPDKSISVLQASKSTSTPLFTVDDRVVQMDQYFLDVDTLLFERIRFRCRVENGELLLCQGLFLM